MDREIAPKYVRENFQPSDRLAVVVLNKRTGAVTQRIATAEKIAAPEFQAWLRHKNAQEHEIYISMSALRTGATCRTKAEIGVVRHLYLDFDENGTEAVERLLKRADLPQPNYRLSSSPGKWQLAWKAEGFTPDEAERLQRDLARQTGADPAATDCARVLRLPGFYNYKYDRPHFVTAETLEDRVHHPDDFPSPVPETRAAGGFALIAAGGELATTLCITGWKRGEALAAAARCFHSWLRERGTAGPSGEEAAIHQVFEFIERHSASRFMRASDSDSVVVNRAGFIQNNKKTGQTEYLIFPETFNREVCSAYNYQFVARALAARKMLACQKSDHLTVNRRLPELGMQRVYAVILLEDKTGNVHGN